MEGYESKTGKQSLNLFLFSLYKDPYAFLREYVQNAYDSLCEARRRGILEPGGGNVWIRIDRAARTLSISDDGVGVPRGEIGPRLLDISNSSKAGGGDTAGRFGIGRLTGAMVCERLVFSTTAAREELRSTLTLDCQAIDAAVKAANDDRQPTQIIDATSALREEAAPAEEHGFEVRLEGIKPEHSDCLEAEALRRRLALLAPVDFDMPFRQHLLEPALRKQPEFEPRVAGLGRVNLTIEGMPVCKPYGLTVEGSQDRIQEISFFSLVDAGEELGWGWWAVTPFTQTIKRDDPLRGLFLRQHNIALGNGSALEQCFPEARGYTYFCGEVHATHPGLRPTAPRDGIPLDALSVRFFDAVQRVCKQLMAVVHAANECKSGQRHLSKTTREVQEGVRCAAELARERERQEQRMRKSSKALSRIAVQLPGAATVASLYDTPLFVAEGGQESGVTTTPRPATIDNSSKPGSQPPMAAPRLPASFEALQKAGQAGSVELLRCALRLAGHSRNADWLRQLLVRAIDQHLADLAAKTDDDVPTPTAPTLREP